MSEFILSGSNVFGRYCLIEMHRYNSDNEFYVHKVIKSYRSNRYCDVPLKGGYDHEATLHHAKDDAEFPDNLEDVIDVIQCGIDETHVFTVALKDVKMLPDSRDELIVHLKEENTNLQEERDMYRDLVGLMCHPDVVDGLEDLVRLGYAFIHQACEQYPRLFDPNIRAGGQIVRAMPDVEYRERMRDLGMEVE